MNLTPTRNKLSFPLNLMCNPNESETHRKQVSIYLIPFSPYAQCEWIWTQLFILFNPCTQSVESAAHPKSIFNSSQYVHELQLLSDWIRNHLWILSNPLVQSNWIRGSFILTSIFLNPCTNINWMLYFDENLWKFAVISCSN